ncbi:hypothetical protein CEXT_713821 [Caerostris extrusa]|uniref:Cytochrome-c oxidase n=1 Tax=Caerostris extrusa TaxID=172846 RepID=A0AAV4SCC7_CAEEX|nr:hypothetical protein CEXT_713821 [Caerostris extrusa]
MIDSRCKVRSSILSCRDIFRKLVVHRLGSRSTMVGGIQCSKTDIVLIYFIQMADTFDRPKAIPQRNGGSLIKAVPIPSIFCVLTTLVLCAPSTYTAGSWLSITDWFSLFTKTADPHSTWWISLPFFFFFFYLGEDDVGRTIGGQSVGTGAHSVWMLPASIKTNDGINDTHPSGSTIFLMVGAEDSSQENVCIFGGLPSNGSYCFFICYSMVLFIRFNGLK